MVQYAKLEYKDVLLHGSGEVQLSEIRQAVLQELKSKSTILGTDGNRYHVLNDDSEDIYVWDPSRNLQLDQRRTNFWDDRPLPQR